MAWELNNAHSLIGFSVKHMMVTTVRGRFNKFSGTFEIEEQNPAASKVDVTIDVASIDTGDDNRDNHLRSPDFFDAPQYPNITYKSTKIEKLSNEQFRVTGNLTIHGVTREVPLEVTYEGQTKDMQGQRLAAFSAHTSISRKDFGLNWNVALESGGWLVSDKVNIDLEAQVIEPATAPAASA